MIGALDAFTRTVKKYYDETGNTLVGGKQGIDQFLFSTDDMDTAANFTLDTLISNPYAVRHRNRDEQSHVREYEPGVGMVYPVPHVSEKTPISERLLDSVATGIESTQGFDLHTQKMISDIINQHVAAHTVTRWKLALDTIRTGVFEPLGLDGVRLDSNYIDFQRDASLTINYDFTAAGADINEALEETVTAYRTLGGNPESMCFILGQSLIELFQSNDTVMERMQANAANILVRQPLMPPELMSTQGLYLIADYLIPGTLQHVYICGYSPRYQFVSGPGASETAFMPADEGVLFSIPDTRYRVMRGVNALSGNGQRTRAVGEIVFDSFVNDDPVNEYLRSQSRNAFIAGNINRTARLIGDFAPVS